MLSRLKGSAKRISAVLLISGGVLLTATAPVYAQEGTTSQTNQGPAGIGILILLMGLGAIVLVGVAYAAQGRSDQDKDARHAKSDEEQ